MVTWEHSGNRGMRNRLPSAGALVNSLIPLTRIPETARKSSGGKHLPCVVFLKVGRWVKIHRSVQTEKGDK